MRDSHLANVRWGAPSPEPDKLKIQVLYLVSLRNQKTILSPPHCTELYRISPIPRQCRVAAVCQKGQSL